MLPLSKCFCTHNGDKRNKICKYNVSQASSAGESTFYSFSTKNLKCALTLRFSDWVFYARSLFLFLLLFLLHALSQLCLFMHWIVYQIDTLCTTIYLKCDINCTFKRWGECDLDILYTPSTHNHKSNMQYKVWSAILMQMDWIGLDHH